MSYTDRPLSPHLQVYRMYFTMIVSMGHRLAGLGLGLGTLWLAWWLVAASSGPDAFAGVQDFTRAWYGRLLLFGFTYALMHHLLNGIRHLFWDAGQGFEKETVEKTAWGVAVGGLVLTLIAWVVGYHAAGVL